MKCHYCDKPVDPRADGVHQYAKGWVMNRSGGGGHGLSLPVRSNLWACASCIRDLTSGSFGTGSLFPEAKTPVVGGPEPTNAAFNDRGRLTHACNVCGADAYFGIGVNLRKGDLGLWYCMEHRPKREEKAA